MPDAPLRARVKRYMAERGVEKMSPEERRRLAEEAQAKLERIPIDRDAAEATLRVLRGRVRTDG